MSALCPGGYPEEVFERYHRINAELWREFERGSITLPGLRVQRFRALFAPQDPAADPAAAASLYVEILSTKGFLMPHAREILEELSRRACLALLSNGICQVQRGRIARAGIEPFFRQIVISEEVGLAKPDPRIFQLAVRRLGLKPEEVLSVGDSPASDIRGGHLAGLDTCWYGPPGSEYPKEEPEPDYRISDLRELAGFAPVS